MSDQPPKLLPYYTPGQVLLACLLGSPLAGGWLMARTFRGAGEKKREVVVLASTSLVTVVLLVLAFLLPKGRSGTGLAAIAAGVVYQIAKQQLWPVIALRKKDGATQASWWMAAAVGVICMIGIFAALAAIMIIVPQE
jgi:hypothetical protein